MGNGRRRGWNPVVIRERRVNETQGSRVESSRQETQETRARTTPRPGCDTGRAPGRGPWGPQFRGHPRSLWPERERPLKRGRVMCVCELLRHVGVHIAKALKGTCEEARQPAWTLPGTFHPAPSLRCLTFCNTHHFVLKQLSLKPRREGQTLFL